MPASLPPQLAQRLLQRYCPLGMLEAVEGDLAERYQRRQASGHILVNLWYWKEVLLVCLWHGHTNREFDLARGLIMWNNYMTVAWRHMRRHKGYTTINLSGLALGLASCLLIFLYVQDELSYDRHHQKADRIYRLTNDAVNPEGTRYWAASPMPWGPALAETYPEIEALTRLYRDASGKDPLVSYGEQSHYESNVLYADSTVFDVFSFDFLAGQPVDALTATQTVVLTASTAQKYFGTTEAVGHVLTFDQATDYTVTGVIADLPATSHFSFDLLVSFETVQRQNTWFLDAWLSRVGYTYLVLHESVSPESMAPKLAEFVEARMGEQLRSSNSHLVLDLQPLTSIHLYSSREQEVQPTSDMMYVYLFSALAVLVLVLACINFMNLSLARATNRAREIGVRKVMGAKRMALMQQFISESVLMALVAVGIAIVLVQFLLPGFNSLSGKTLTLSFFDQPLLLPAMLLLALAVGILTGLYPALGLSRFRPVQVIKGSFVRGRQGIRLRQGLIVFQFMVSIMLIASTLLIAQQVDFMRSRDLGFAKEQLITIPLGDSPIVRQTEAFKSALRQHPGIAAASAVSNIPGRRVWLYGFRPEHPDVADWMIMRQLFVDADYVATMGLDIVQGRSFDEAFGRDSLNYMLNEAAVRAIGWDDPLSKRMLPQAASGVVVGVINDFNYASLHGAVEPLVITMDGSLNQYLIVRINTTAVPEVLAHLEATWSAFAPDWTFSYSFLDQSFDQLYQADVRLREIMRWGTVLGMVIACLGLLGLAAFTAQQRVKEIGIRKTLGASSSSVVLLLSKDFTRLVLLASVLATPVAFIILKNWLGGFAYATPLNAQPFLIAGGLALLIAWLTVGYQAVRAAMANPVEALRHE